MSLAHDVSGLISTRYVRFRRSGQGARCMLTASGTRLGLGSPVADPVITIFLVAPVPPPHLSVGDPDDLGCLPPGNLLR